MRFIASFSGGKDSMLAIDRAIASGNTLVGLLVATKNKNTSWFHDINEEVLLEIAERLQVPLFMCPCREGEGYTKDFERALKQAKGMTDAQAVTFGDIDIEEHRTWCTQRAKEIGLEPLFPLWQEDRTTLVKEFIDKGYKTVVKKVEKTKLHKGFLGKTLDYNMIQSFVEMGIDPCGENGEYHTLVYDGPMFDSPIKLETICIMEDEWSYSTDFKVKGPIN